MQKTINTSRLDVDTVKAFSDSHPDYEATHYLCLVPSYKVTGVFASSYKEVHGTDIHPAYWAVFDTKQKGYTVATKRYAIENTESDED